jgi:hypothetical protein
MRVEGQQELETGLVEQCEGGACVDDTEEIAPCELGFAGAPFTDESLVDVGRFSDLDVGTATGEDAIDYRRAAHTAIEALWMTEARGRKTQMLRPGLAKCGRRRI